MPDPRTRYAVEADRACERGEWLFAETARQRGAELAMRPDEEWELVRVESFGFLSALLGLRAPFGFTFAGYDLARVARGDRVETDGAVYVVAARDVEAGTITLTAQQPVATTITLASEMEMPRHAPSRSRVPCHVQQNRQRLDGRRS